MKLEEIMKMETHFECPACNRAVYDGEYRYCPRCGIPLETKGHTLVSLREYAGALLLEYLTSEIDYALGKYLSDIPDYATEYINVNGSVLHNTEAAVQVLAQNWAEVEEALEYYRDGVGEPYQWNHAEQLHAFCVIQHAHMLWAPIAGHYECSRLAEDDVEGIIARLEAELQK